MDLTIEEKRFLADLLENQIKNFSAGEKTLMQVSPVFLKKTHEIEDFMNGLLKKLRK